jgi:hypothetical protein
MDIARELRMELNQLSKEVFGVSSKWQKILRDGTTQVLTRTVKETVPGKEGEEPTVKEVQVPILTEYGAKQLVTTRYTLEEVHQMLLGYKVQLENFRTIAKQQQEEKAAKEAEHKALKDVHDTAYGSAVK